MFDGPYKTEITWRGCASFVCPHCGKPIKTGEKVVAYPNPKGTVWHTTCRKIWEGGDDYAI